ncbi:MAG: LemA family protein [Bryobacterales bacterium]|nr:LemA family protein [Bryobacterales bacterium]
MREASSPVASDSSRPSTGRRFLLVLIIALVISVFAGSSLDAEREELDTSRGRIEERWGDLNRDLQLRAGLAEELVGAFDKATRRPAGRDLVAARNSLTGSVSAFDRANGREAAVETSLSVERALSRFLRLVEEEPVSRVASDSSEPPGHEGPPGLRRALDELQVAEHRVAIRRTAYNEAIQQYNIRLALFPANLAARVFGFERYPYYLPTDIRDTIEGQLPDAGRAGKENGTE